MSVKSRCLLITVGERTFEASLTSVEGSSPQYAVILTHGAGGSKDTGELPALAECLASSSLLCLRFTCKSLNLKYRSKVFTAILEQVPTLAGCELKGYIIGGRSMGSRAAIEVANSSQGTQLQSLIKGVICLSYPLIGSNGDIRDRPLFQLEKPVFFISGLQDGMCPRSRMEDTMKQMENIAEIHWIPGAKHGFDSGAMIRTTCEVVENWCSNVFRVDDYISENLSEEVDTLSPYGNKVHNNQDNRAISIQRSLKEKPTGPSVQGTVTGVYAMDAETFNGNSTAETRTVVNSAENRAEESSSRDQAIKTSARFKTRNTKQKKSKLNLSTNLVSCTKIPRAKIYWMRKRHEKQDV